MSKIVLAGTPPIVTHHELASDEYLTRAGQLAIIGFNGQVMPTEMPEDRFSGFLGYEHTEEKYRPTDPSKPFPYPSTVAILRGGGFIIQAWLAPGETISKGEPIVSAGHGTLKALRGPPQVHSKKRMDFVHIPILAYAESDVAEPSGSVLPILVRSII
jgi:hypothetical protein